jgi:hypothetical protein
MAFLVEWRMTNGQTGQKEYPDEELQSVLDRIWKSFGNPDLIQGGPSIGPAKSDGLTNTQKPRRRM